MSVLIVIPARYASSRFPGKPLATLKGASGQDQSLIERSWRAAMAVKGVDRVVVATDDDRISNAAEAFGAEVIMTSTSCRNGTERCAEVLAKVGNDYDIIVNLQGDAPLTPSWFVEDLIDGLKADQSFDVATPVLRADGATLAGFKNDRSHGRVGGTTAVFASNMKALYFSKEVIPYVDTEFAPNAPTPVFHHVGVYAYRPSALKEYLAHPIGTYEELEGLEQLRFLEAGHSILCVEVEAKGRQFWELNNPEDVPKIEAMLRAMGVD